MADVIVVRHGETISEPGICIGRTNVPLSERGRKRAEILGKYLKEKYPDIGRIITSPLDRAVATALEVSKFYEIMPETDENVTEIDLGKWEGKHFDKIREEDPSAFMKRGEDPWDYRISEAETFYEAALRFQKRINVYAEDEKDVLVAAHKGVITGLFAELGYADKKDLFHVSCPNLSISVFRMHDEQLQVADGPYRPSALLDDVLIADLYQKHQTPANVIAHMRAVAEYAIKILDDLHSDYDREKIYKAALLHDLDRTKKHHAKVSAESLRREGFRDIADMVEEHHREEYDPSQPVSDADILWYADKCILEDKVVSIEERFALSKEKCRDEEALLHHQRRYEKACYIRERIKQEGRNETD